MLFNSYEFIFLYLPIVLVVYFFLGSRKKYEFATTWLVLSSIFFYGYWDCRYVALLLASICFNYIIGRMIERKSRKRIFLIIGLAVNILLLGYYKYTGFFMEQINATMGTDMIIPHIVLPLGISFFTFTQSAYLIDAYRGETTGYSFKTYCLFVTVFPHLIAGPIIYHKDMIPQFMNKANCHINYDNMAMGLALFSVGLFKKIVIADNISIWVNSIFNHYDQLNFLEAWAGALGYTFQLYFDFSAYSEMAIALGLMLNLRLPVNFNSPYQALSIIDFWRRWHMTLGTWVKSYLYIPMGGNRHGEFAKMRNLFVSMLIIGLWHGAGWTFIFWGGMHGLLLMINHQWRRTGIALPKPICWALTFFSVMLAWIFFRAENFAQALQIIHSMFDFQDIYIAAANWRVDKNAINVWSAIAGLGILIWLPNPIIMLRKFKANWIWFSITLIALLISMYQMNTYSEFLYFQF